MMVAASMSAPAFSHSTLHHTEQHALMTDLGGVWVDRGRTVILPNNDEAARHATDCNFIRK